MSSSPICQTTDEMLGQDCEATEEKQAPAAETCTTLDGEGTTVDGEGTTLNGEGTTLDGEGKDTTAASESAAAYTIKKFFDIDEIWAEKAGPDDELARYTLSMSVNGHTLLAHMITDPLIESTTLAVEYMKREGFEETKRETVLRKNIDDKDVKLLRKSQFTDPDQLLGK